MIVLSPRPSTSSGNGPPVKANLPTIEHPMSRNLKDRDALKRQGAVSGIALHRSRTFVTVDNGKCHLGLNHPGLPPVSPRNGYDAASRHSHSSDFPTRIRSAKGKYRRSIDKVQRLSIAELEQILREKMASGQHGIKHLFRSNDPTGQGSVSKAGLMKILYSLVGYISADMLNTLLKRMNLEQRTQFTFDDLCPGANEKEAVQSEWLSPVHKMDVQKKTNPEAHLRMPTDFHFKDPRITASTGHTLMKERLRQKGYDMLYVFPETCRGRYSLILPQHLSSILHKLDINMEEEDFQKLWQRYDREGVGGIKRAAFFSMLGLDDVGNVVIPSESKDQNLGNPFNTPTGSDLHLDRVPVEPISSGSPLKKQSVALDSPSDKPPSTTSKSSKKTLSSVVSVNRKKGSVKLEDILDVLNFKFEENYFSMMMGMQCFDFLGDDLINKVDFKRVLAEFGMNMQSMLFDHFLTKAGVKCVRGQVPYKDFLMKFWNKGDSGLVQRIVNKNPMLVNGGVHPSSTADLTEEELEIKLVDFLHRDFLCLQESLKKADKYKIGVVTKHEFRDTVEKLLGYSMATKQWDNLMSTVGMDKDGLVPYPKLLKMFTTSLPGKWNRKDFCGFPINKTKHNPTGEVGRLQEERDRDLAARQEELDKLKEHKSEYISMELKARIQENVETLQNEKHGRSLKQLNALMKDLFASRYNDMKRVFRFNNASDNINKEQLRDLLRQFDVKLVPKEIDELWNTVTADGNEYITFKIVANKFCDNGTYTADRDQDLKDKLTQLRDKFDGKDASSGAEVISMPKGTAFGDQFINIVNKIKPMVHQQWKNLKSLFRYADKEGRAFILGEDMKDIVEMMHFQLSADEVRRLLRAFDNKRDGHFHYIEFLKVFGAKINDNNTPKAKGCQRSQGYEAISPKQLSKEQKKVRKAFKKADTSGTGVVSVNEFKNVLRSCGFKITAEDLYHILSEFDSNMDGRIDYNDFLSQHLTGL